MRETRRGARATDVVERGLSIFLVVWTAAFLGLQAELRPSPENGPVVSAAVLLAGVLVLVGLAATLGPRPWRRAVVPVAVATTAALAVASLVALTTIDVDAAKVWPTGVSYMTVAVGVAGLRLRARWAAPVIVGLVLAQTVAILPSSPGVRTGLASAVLYGLYVLVLGVVCVVFATVLRRAAVATAAAHRLLRRTSTARDAAEAVRRDIAAHERALHDTVLNTLGAVGRGELAGHEEEVRRWCAQAAEEVRSLSQPGGSTGGAVAPGTTLIDSALALAPAMTLPVEGRDLSLDGIPSDVGTAMVTATGEVLRNVARHAEATAVRVRASTAPDGTVTVMVQDDGQGFDAAAHPPRLGLTRSVRGAMRNVGGSAAVESHPGEGTVVTLSWSPAPGPVATRRLSDEVAAAVSRVAPVVLIPSGVLALASLLVSLGDYERLGLAIAAFAVMVVTYAVEGVAGRRGRLTWPVAVGVLVATPVVYRLENAAHAMEPGLWSSWSAEAMLSALIVVVVAGPRWAWAPALVTWWATMGFDPLEFIRPGGALLLSSAVLSVALQEGSRSYERTVAEATRLETELVAAREAERRRRDRWAGLRVTTLPLLEGLAEGALSPDDPAVRSRCRDEQRYVRALVRLDPEDGPLPAMLLDLVDVAHEHRVPLEVDLRDDVDTLGPLRQTDVARTSAALTAVIGGLPPDPGGVPLRLSGGAESGAAVLRLVAPHPVSASLATGTGLRSAGDDDHDLWEAVLAADDGGDG